jgi:hypothetical protein
VYHELREAHYLGYNGTVGMRLTLRSPVVVALSIILILGACGAFTKLYFFGLTDSSDYQEYVATAKLISGVENASAVPHRLLKPLNPLLVAGLAMVFNYQTAFILQALVFYFALTATTFFLAREFFDDIFKSALVALLSALSYPVLKYGVEINAETGALFFYVLSLYLTVRFLKQPRGTIFLANVLVITLGFLWKEYSIVAAIIFGLSLLMHPQLSIRRKAMHVGVYGAIFLTIHASYQTYIYLQYDYTYLSWYLSNAPAGYAHGEFTLRTITKSTAALLGLAWLLVPIGLYHFKTYQLWQRRFLQSALLPPMIGYTWGYVSSRLLYVMAPPFLLVVGMGLARFSLKTQIVVVVVVIAANIAWLFLSYKVAL